MRDYYNDVTSKLLSGGPPASCTAPSYRNEQPKALKPNKTSSSLEQLYENDTEKSDEPSSITKDSGLLLGKVVFDLDDVGWGAQARVAQQLGISYDLLDDFRITENRHLTATQKSQILDWYRDPEFYRDIQFICGFEKVMELEREYPICVQLNSNSGSTEVRDAKIPQICARVPDLPPEQMRFGIVGVDFTKKRFDDDTLILVDDSPHNVSLSPALLNIVPIQPWNITEKALAIMTGKPILYVPFGNFDAIYHAIDEFFAKLLPLTDGNPRNLSPP